MIYNVSILRGYTALRGTSIMHIPMLVIHLALVRVPSAGEDGADYFPEAKIWYWYAVVMHALMAALHILGFVEERRFELALESTRILSVIL